MNIFAYADDIAIVCTHRLNALDLARKTLIIVDQVCKELGLKISQTKSKAMYMFCTRVTHELTIGGAPIAWVNEYKYLGITLDRSLTFVPLAMEVAYRMRKRLFVMQRIAGLTWGAAGTVLELFYKQAVRSVYDYASPFLAIAHSNLNNSRTRLPTNKRFLSATTRIERVQYQAARLILRVSTTTRTEMLLLETNLEPLYIRAQLTLAVFLMKTTAGILSAIANKMRKFMSEGYSNRLRLSLALRRVLLQSKERFGAEMVDIPPPTSHPPWFVVPCKFVVNTPQKKSEVSPHDLKATAMAEIEQLTIANPYATQVYTDGSLNPDTGGAGASAVFPSDGISLGIRISDFASSLCTELVGIDMALKSAYDIDVVIHTDSLNAIRKIGDRNPQNILAVSIQLQLIEREKNGWSTTLHWIPSHVGIPGNERADKAALKAAKGAEITQICLISASQCKLTAKKHAMRMWNDSLNQETIRMPNSNSWTWYRRVHKVIPAHLGEKSRRVLSIVSRIKLGHRRWVDRPKYTLCPCGSSEFRMAHIIVACKKLDYTPLLHHLEREELISLDETDAAMKVLSWCEKDGWKDLVDFYELNQAQIEGLDAE